MLSSIILSHLSSLPLLIPTIPPWPQIRLQDRDKSTDAIEFSSCVIFSTSNKSAGKVFSMTRLIPAGALHPLATPNFGSRSETTVPTPLIRQLALLTSFRWS